MTALALSRGAQLDLDEILVHIAQDDITTAARVVSTILERIEVLRDHPRIGRVGRVRGTRELVVPETRYVVAYRVNDYGVVTVLRVIHSARRWPKRL